MKLKGNEILTILFSWIGVFMVIGGLCTHTYPVALLGVLSMCIGIIIVLQKEFSIFNRKK